MLCVFTVRKDENHLASLNALKRIDACADGVVEPGRVAELQAIEFTDQQVTVPGKLDIREDLDLVVERAHLATVVWQHADNELLGTRHE